MNGHFLSHGLAAIALLSLAGCREAKPPEHELAATEQAIEQILDGVSSMDRDLERYCLAGWREALNALQQKPTASEFDRPLSVMAYLTHETDQKGFRFAIIWLESGISVASVIVENVDGTVLTEGRLLIGPYAPRTLIRQGSATVAWDDPNAGVATAEAKHGAIGELHPDIDANSVQPG